MTSRFPCAGDNLEFLTFLFSNPWIFAREWVQSAVLTRSSRIDFSLIFKPGTPDGVDSEAPGELQLRIRDDGSGYALEAIESQIRRLLSYAPKVGEWSEGQSVLPYFQRMGPLEEFQLAFLSLFTLQPASLRIQTGNAQASTSTVIQFDREQGLEIYTAEQSFLGLEVVWSRSFLTQNALLFEARLRQDIEFWCRFCPLEIRYSLTSTWTACLLKTPYRRSSAWRWAAEEPQIALSVSVNDRLEITEVLKTSCFSWPSRCVTDEENDEFRLSISPCREAGGKYELYSSGIWLTAGQSLENVPPGVHFRADSILLKAYPTRDGVCQDQGLQTIVRRVGQLVNQQLRPRLFRVAAMTDDPEERENLWGCLVHRLRGLPFSLLQFPLVPTVNGRHCSILKLRWTAWNWGGLYWSYKNTADSDAFNRLGIPVIYWRGPSEPGAQLQTFLEAAVPGVKLSKVEGQTPPKYSRSQVIGGALLSTCAALALRHLL